MVAAWGIVAGFASLLLGWVVWNPIRPSIRKEMEDFLSAEMYDGPACDDSSRLLSQTRGDSDSEGAQLLEI